MRGCVFQQLNFAAPDLVHASSAGDDEEFPSYEISSLEAKNTAEAATSSVVPHRLSAVSSLFFFQSLNHHAQPSGS